MRLGYPHGKILICTDTGVHVGRLDACENPFCPFAKKGFLYLCDQLSYRKLLKRLI